MFKPPITTWKEAVFKCIAENGGELCLGEVYELIKKYVDIDESLMVKRYGKIIYKKKIMNCAWSLMKEGVLRRVGVGCYALTAKGKKDFLIPDPPIIPFGKDHRCHNCGTSLLGGNLGRVTTSNKGDKTKFCRLCARNEKFNIS